MVTNKMKVSQTIFNDYWMQITNSFTLQHHNILYNSLILCPDWIHKFKLYLVKKRHTWCWIFEWMRQSLFIQNDNSILESFIFSRRYSLFLEMRWTYFCRWMNAFWSQAIINANCFSKTGNCMTQFTLLKFFLFKSGYVNWKFDFYLDNGELFWTLRNWTNKKDKHRWYQSIWKMHLK